MQLVPIQFLETKIAPFVLKFSGMPHAFVTNISSLSHPYCAIHWFVSLKVMWWSYDVWSRFSWLCAWSGAGRMCGRAHDQHLIGYVSMLVISEYFQALTCCSCFNVLSSF